MNRLESNRNCTLYLCTNMHVGRNLFVGKGTERREVPGM
jgi:hypothetical protein